MSFETPPRKRRIKRVYRHPNLLFEKWLQEWRDEAEAKGSQMKYNYARAIKSLKSFPLPLYRGADCKVLSGFGDKICQQIDRKMQKHIEQNGPIDWEQYHQVVDHSGPRKKRAKKQPSSYANSIDPDDPDDPDDPQVVNRPAPRKRPAKKKTTPRAVSIDPDDPEGSNISLNTSRKRGSRPYVPAVRSGAYAILMAFHQAAADEGFPDHLKRGELMESAQEFCDASFTQAPDGSHYTAWSSMATLLRKHLITKEGSPARYTLTVAGEELCERLVSAEEGGNRQVDISQELERQGTSQDYICEDLEEQGLRKKKKPGNSKKVNKSSINQKSESVNTEMNKELTLLSSNGCPTENTQNDWSFSDPEDLQDYFSNSIHEESILQKDPDVIYDECLMSKNQELKQTDADCHYADENSPKRANETCTIASENILEEFWNCSLTDSSLSQLSIMTCENRLTKDISKNGNTLETSDLEKKLIINIRANEESLKTSDLDITLNTDKIFSKSASTVIAQTSYNRLPCAGNVASHIKQYNHNGADSQSSISGATLVPDHTMSPNTSSSSSSTRKRSTDESDIPQHGSSDFRSYTLQSEKENLSLINNNVSSVLKPKIENALNNNNEYNKSKYLNGWITAQKSYLKDESSMSSTILTSENGEFDRENENKDVVKENENGEVVKEYEIAEVVKECGSRKVIKENENKEVFKENYPNVENDTKMMMMTMMNTKKRIYEEIDIMEGTHKYKKCRTKKEEDDLRLEEYLSGVAGKPHNQYSSNRKDRMEGTNKYKNYRGKYETNVSRNNDYVSYDEFKPKKQFSSKRKGRRKRKKSESSSEEESNDVIPEIRDDPKQPGPVIVPPIICLIPTKNWKNLVFFDLETTSLKLDCDIVQIAAIDGFTNDTFNLYVKPTKKMDKMASFITKISFKKGILRHKHKPVYADPAPKALEKFLFWIQQRSPVTLVAHNASFDSKRLFYVLNLHKLTTEYKKHIIGFVDTLTLFKRKYPHLPNHKQETIVKHILNIEYDAHNALEDVKSLKEVYNNTFLDYSTPNMAKSSTDFASAHEQWLYELEGKKRATTFAEMLSKKFASDKMIEKMANSGLSKGNLEFVHKSKGAIGIENLLGKIGKNGKPIVTNNKRVINDIVQYFTNEDVLKTSDLDITANTGKISLGATSIVKAQTSHNRSPFAGKLTSHLKQYNHDGGPSADSQSLISESDIPQLGSSDDISHTLKSEKENLSLISNNVSAVLKSKNENICKNALSNKIELNRDEYLNGWLTAQKSNIQNESRKSSTCLKSENGEIDKVNGNEELVKDNEIREAVREIGNMGVVKENENRDVVNENGEVVKGNYSNVENDTKLMMMTMMNTKNLNNEKKYRMEGTHKYKKNRGKKKEDDLRLEEYLSEVVSKPNNQYSSKGKKRRKRKKSESSSEEESKDVIPEIRDDPKQPGPVIVPPSMCTIPTKNWKNLVFFDLETTSLKLDCDIVQIAAIDGFTNDTFNLYVKPTKKMDKMAAFITKISFKKGILRHKFKPVYADPAPKALEKFLFWIQQRSPVTLVAHNASFDSKRLFYALNLHRLTAEFKKHTIGFVDTLTLFKRKYPRLPNHKQETIVKHILNIEYDGHNALEDVKSLKEVYNNTFLDYSTPNMAKSSTDFVSAHEQWLYELEGKKRATTFADMLSKKCASDKIIEKMANSGLTKGNLEFVYESKGVIGIKNLLGKIGKDGKPRVTSNERVINEIVKYFTL